MANLYEKVITELSFYNNNNQVSNPIIIPYDPLQDYQAQTINGKSKALLCYAFYLGELLKMMPPEQRTFCIRQLPRYYAAAVVRTYYIFRKWGTTRINQTRELKLLIIYKLK
ncbi:1836_t:CDS:2, partial [Gigaspora rosea]